MPTARSISNCYMVKATKLLKLSATIHRRLYVDYIDCVAMLLPMIWNVPNQKTVIYDWLLDNIASLSLMELSCLQLVVDNLHE